MKKPNNISIYLHPSIVEALRDCPPRGRSKRLAEICQAYLTLPAAFPEWGINSSDDPVKIKK